MKLLRIVLFSFLLFTSFSIQAQLKLASLFTSNMVLQQQSNVPIWGWTHPGKSVTVRTSWNKQRYTTRADETGKWTLKVSTPSAGGPYNISVSDGSVQQLDNVLIGEVWFCSGQSNMEMPMKGFKGQPILGSNEAILFSKNDQLRLYTVPRSSQTQLQPDTKPSAWKMAEPETVSNFSATAWYFGSLLQKMLGVPVGLINDSYSGSYAQAWMSPEALSKFPGITIPKKNDTIKQVSRTPTTLYNGMLRPAAGYGIRGVIWYQGESNYEDPDLYEQLFPTMVSEWRNLWGMGDFPFYYAQIAPYNYAQLPPYYTGGKYNSAYLRDAQRKMEQRIPNSAMAVLLDVGEENNIHPADKKTGGHRLAYLALAKTYGLKGFGYASPVFDTLTVQGSVANLRFQQSPNGLTSFGKELTLFQIAGKDKVFHPAKATISGSSVAVSSPRVPEPVAVRYAFTDFTGAELFSTEGLPVSSFRTDDW